MDARLYNGLTLAYIGDGVYETYIRCHLLSLGITKVNDLHKSAIKYTSGEAQANIIRYFKDKSLLSDEELMYYKRGRNSNIAKTRKNIDRINYLEGTGFESLIGYLYLCGNIKRMNELFDKAIEFVELGGDHLEK